jgi:fatty-acyl-CoA synthase
MPAVARIALAPNPFERATAYEMLATVASQHRDRLAIVFEAERITYAELLSRVDTLADGFAALGLTRGDTLAIWLPNRPAWFAAQLAAAKLGIVVAGLNPRYKAHELSYILAQSDTTAFLLTHHLGGIDYFETLHEVLPGLPDAVPGEVAASGFPRLRHVIVDAEDPYPGCLRLADVHALGLSEPRRETPDDPPGLDDVFTILYTSGTTSFPKGAMLSHRNAVPHGWNSGEVLRLTPDDRVLHVMPAAGTWGGLNIPISTWSHGACLVLMETFEPLRALMLIERERCTVFNSVDMIARALLEHPALERHDRSSLRTGAFAEVGGGGHGLFDDVVHRLGVKRAYQPYGMTEVNALALMHDLDEPHELRALPGIKCVPGIEARVVHPDTGVPCDVDEEGELQFRGPLVTCGYYKKPQETAAAFTADGWFRTGDLAVQDVDGHVVFKGRLREVLRISHFMVAPGEIEAFLMSHPAVDQAFVVGVPDPRTNEAAVAYVIPREGATIDGDALRAYCRGKIASYKIPRAVKVVASVPRTPSPHGDKAQRGKLKEQARLDFADDRATPG